jgi:hypothetical protein
LFAVLNDGLNLTLLCMREIGINVVASSVNGLTNQLLLLMTGNIPQKNV